MYTAFDSSNMPPDGTCIRLTRVTVWVDFRDCVVKAKTEPHEGVLEHKVWFRINLISKSKKSKSKRNSGLVSHRQLGVPSVERWEPGATASSTITYYVWVIDSEVDQALQKAKEELRAELHAIQVRLAAISFDVELKKV